LDERHAQSKLSEKNTNKNNIRKAQKRSCLSGEPPFVAAHVAARKCPLALKDQKPLIITKLGKTTDL